MKRWVVGDFETASACELKQAGAWRYAEDPTTEIICFAWKCGNRQCVWLPGLTLEEIRAAAPHAIEPARLEFFLDSLTDLDELLELVNDPEVIWIAHNTGFEKAIWRHIMVPEFGVPNIPNSRWHDTMAMCAHRALPQELEHAARILRAGVQKDMEGRKITLGMSKADKKGYYDRSIEKRIRSALYCLDDIGAETAVHESLGWLPASERNVWLLNQRVNERGLRLDMEFVRAAQKIVDDASEPLLHEFSLLTNGLKPSQGAKFLSWLHAQNVHLDNLTKETVVEFIGQNEETEDDDTLPTETRDVVLPANAHRCLRIRQLIGSASIKKLKRMEACVSFDGRCRGTSQYHGTAPGRAAGRLFQPYNFPRGTLKIDVGDGKKEAPPPQLVVDAIMTGDYKYVEDVCGAGAVEVVVSSLRHTIVPDRGRVFLSGDYAGIQARVVLALAGQYDKTAIFSDDRAGTKGEDIYLDMAERIFKRKVTKKDMMERQTGKNSVLGLGFQMGWKKFKLKYAKEHPDEFCENIVRVYRKEWAPKVPYLWYGLSDAAVKCVHTGRTTEAHGIEYRKEGEAMSARLPSGRKIWYQDVIATRDKMPWDDEDVRPTFAYSVMKMGQWKSVKAFGGLLTENVVMGIEVDIQRKAMLQLEKNGFPVVLEVYDEIVAEPEIENADAKAFKQILLDVDPWVNDLRIPIAVDIWQGDRYRK